VHLKMAASLAASDGETDHGHASNSFARPVPRDAVNIAVL